jgi:lysyl-tRNA synthetase class II
MNTDDDNSLIAERREKLAAIRAAAKLAGTAAFPNDFKPTRHALELQRKHGAQSNEELEPLAVKVALGGRMMLKRVMGKASFATLQDGSGQIQLFVTRDALGEAAYAAFKHWDLGDILGAEGTLFKTKTGELSVRVSSLRLLTKSRSTASVMWTSSPTRTHARGLRHAARRSARSASSWSNTASWKSRRRCCTRSRGVRTPSLLSPTTTHSTSRCSCASRPSCT